MRIVSVLIFVAIVVSVLCIHRIGSQRVKSAPKQIIASDAKKAPIEPKAEKPEYYQPVKPPEPPPPKIVEVPTPPPPPKPVEAEHFLELIDGYAAEDAVRKSHLFFLPCKGGPSEGRYAVFPVNPKEALSVGSMAVVVTGFDSYVHARIDNSLDNKPEAKKTDTKKLEPKKDSIPPKKEVVSPVPQGSLAPQGETIWVVTLQDHKRMALEHIAVYALENIQGKPRLTFEGTIDTLEYRRFMPISSDSEKGQATDFLDVRTSDAGIRRKRVFPTKCVGGPADGALYPLLVSPSILWEKGLTTVAVTDVTFRPKEHTFSLREEKQPATNLVGHVNLYALEEVRDRAGRFGSATAYQLKFAVALDARTYLKLHNGIEVK